MIFSVKSNLAAFPLFKSISNGGKALVGVKTEHQHVEAGFKMLLSAMSVAIRFAEKLSTRLRSRNLFW